MKPFMLVVVLMFVVCVASLDPKFMRENEPSKVIRPQAHLRSRRSLFEFYRMIKCGTERKAQDYNGYGCWCGKGGKGAILDDLDRCCYIHDHCYEQAQSSGKCSWPWQIYLDSYHRIGCTGCNAEKNSECEQALCECDRNAVKCFAANEWNPQYNNHPKNTC